MRRKELLQSKIARVVVFLWFIVFPIVFIAIPSLEMVLGERDTGFDPVLAFGVWILGPVAAGIVIKYLTRD